MTDRELLELAAKAAGIELEWPQDYGGADHLSPHDTSTRQIWNPLTDDGDALRLAVRLRIKHERHINQPYVAAWAPDIVGRFEESEGSDPCAATRRAIVRVVAEIGKTMSKFEHYESVKNK